MYRWEIQFESEGHQGWQSHLKTGEFDVAIETGDPESVERIVEHYAAAAKQGCETTSGREAIEALLCTRGRCAARAFEHVYDLGAEYEQKALGALLFTEKDDSLRPLVLKGLESTSVGSRLQALEIAGAWSLEIDAAILEKLLGSGEKGLVMGALRFVQATGTQSMRQAVEGLTKNVDKDIAAAARRARDASASTAPLPR